MTIALIIYLAGALVFGGLAMIFEIQSRSAELERTEDRGTLPAPKFIPLWIGLFVAVFWPLVLTWVVT
jgi:hypothetical protein